jgi:hypothetical protein
MSTNHVSIRLDEATMDRIDALSDVFSTEWHVATRSDIFRALILLSLDRYEEEHGLARGGGGTNEREEREAPPGEPSAVNRASGRRRRKRGVPSPKRGG